MRIMWVLVFTVVLLTISQLVVTDGTLKQIRKPGDEQLQQSNAALNMAIAYVNASKVYSPVTLNQEWPAMGRFLFAVLASTLGTTINGFFVASFFVEDCLRNHGNVYLACTGLSDLINTAAVMPISAVALLSSSAWDTLQVCRMMQFLTETANYSFSLFFLFNSLENYFRTCRSPAEYAYISGCRTCLNLVASLMFLTSAVLAASGVYLNFDLDYCVRFNSGYIKYRVTTLIIFHVLPAFISLVCLLNSIIRVNVRAHKWKAYRRSWQYEWDSSISKLNLSALCLFLMHWTPFVIDLYVYPLSKDPLIYLFAYIGVCRSIFGSLLYTSLNRNIRHASARVFYYICCKNSLSKTIHHRRRRRQINKLVINRVHIVNEADSSCSRHTSKHTNYFLEKIEEEEEIVDL